MISKLHIENFKAFKELDLNFSNLNVFAGINGIGKSSVIQSLLLIRQSTVAVGSPAQFGLQINGDLINLGTGKDVLHSDSSEDYIKFILDFDNKETLALTCEYEPKLNILHFKEQIVAWNIEQALFNNEFQYLGAQRAEPSFYYPMDSYKVEKLRTLGKYGELTAHFLAVNKRKEFKSELLYHKNAKSKHLINQVIAWLNEISPGVSIDSSLVPDLNLAKVVYSFNSETGYSPDFSPVNVGFGYSYVLPVLTAILSASSDSLLIIENPESHLHPRGQAVLGLMLGLAAKSGMQLFIETHSDHIMNGIRIAIKNHDVSKETIRIFFFDREEGESNTEVYYPSIDNDGRMTNLPEGFMDEYSKQLDQLIM